MKKAMAMLLAAGFLAGATSGCAYGMIATSGADKVVITRQDSFLFGALRKVFVCKITDNGAASCAEAESP
jgi:hypothetical protein